MVAEAGGKWLPRPGECTGAIYIVLSFEKPSKNISRHAKLGKYKIHYPFKSEANVYFFQLPCQPGLQTAFSGSASSSENGR